LTVHGRCRVEALHGDKTQPERTEALARFKRGGDGDWCVMVATDVASRGLDIPSIKTVVCYDAARRPEDHTHRIGRTGRAGAEDGTAYTLLTAREEDAAVEMVRSLLSASQAPAADLLALARKSRRWTASGLQKRLTEAAGGGAGGSKGRPTSLTAESARGGGGASWARPPAEFAPPPLQPPHPPPHYHPPVPTAAHPPPAPPPHGLNDAMAEARAKAQEMAARLTSRATAPCQAASAAYNAGLWGSAVPPPPPPGGPPPPLGAQPAADPHPRPSRWS